jgi:predicted nucleotide-binding protein (sugar kinase/HSP70/actin superfamily)
MQNKIKIGLPRAFLYYKYQYLWKTFFEQIGCEIILSPETNREILKNGINFSIDESCLSSKIYMGHVHYLINKVDYILIPRIVSFGKNEVVCTKFNALYDIVNNTFSNVKILDYNVDVNKNQSELDAFINMGKILNKDLETTLEAYDCAKKKEIEEEIRMSTRQEDILNCTDKLKILIVSHPYNTYDKLLGYPIIKHLEQLGVLPVFADIADRHETIKRSINISKGLYWTYNKELIGAIEYYQERIDGIIFITTFPCGPDSLVTELCQRKIKKIPIANIILDELQAEAGLQTRIESFIDIITEKKKVVER